ncbi:hypothetical protein C8J55DRAFT_71463 [Lentinula edodes]|uniref:Uncharacterized protein n=1 Tax=Lentinula lateritia TaxID=40482 RepID=A0A9W9ADF5_9AGAR|nr:hypothetical protein C8J55DRAFT_71463 [Lentinula edodes]
MHVLSTLHILILFSRSIALPTHLSTRIDKSASLRSSDEPGPPSWKRDLSGTASPSRPDSLNSVFVPVAPWTRNDADQNSPPWIRDYSRANAGPPFWIRGASGLNTTPGPPSWKREETSPVSTSREKVPHIA